MLPITALDSFKWAEPLAPLLKLAENSKDTKFYRVVAAHAGVKNRNGRVYTESELRDAASGLSERMLDINHRDDLVLDYGGLPGLEDNIKNGVVAARYEEGTLECIISVSEPWVNDAIKDGRIEHVSIDGRYLDQSKNVFDKNGDLETEYPTSLHLRRLALLTSGTPPGDPRAGIIHDSVERVKDELDLYRRQKDLAPRILEQVVAIQDPKEDCPPGYLGRADMPNTDNPEADKTLEDAELTSKKRDDLSAEKFAWHDPETGEDKLPIHDPAHVRNALARFNQTQGIPEGSKAGVLAKIRAAAKRMGVEVSEGIIQTRPITGRSMSKKALDKAAEKRVEKQRLLDQVKKIDEDLIIIDPEGDESQALLKGAEDQYNFPGKMAPGKLNTAHRDDMSPQRDGQPPNDGHGHRTESADDGGDAKKTLVGMAPDLREGKLDQTQNADQSGGDRRDGKLLTAKSEGTNPNMNPAYNTRDAVSGSEAPLGERPSKAASGGTDISAGNAPMGQDPVGKNEGDLHIHQDEETPSVAQKNPEQTTSSQENPSNDIKTNLTVTRDATGATRIKETVTNTGADMSTVGKEVQDAAVVQGERMGKAMASAFLKEINEAQSGSSRVEGGAPNGTMMTSLGLVAAPLSADAYGRKVQEANFQLDLPRYTAIAKSFQGLKPIDRPTSEQWKQAEIIAARENVKIGNAMLQVMTGVKEVNSNTITAASASSALGQVWLPDMIILPTDLVANLRNYAQVQIIERGANIVHFVRITQPVFVSLTDLTVPSSAAQTIDKIDITVAETGAMAEIAYSVLESATPDVPAAVERSFMYAAIIDEDNSILVAVDAAVPSGNIVLAGGSAAEGNITSAMTFLAKYLADALTDIMKQGYTVNSGDLVAVLHPVQYDALLKDTAVSQFLNFGSFAPIQQGVVPQVYGVDIVRSTKVVTNTNGSGSITLYRANVWLKPSARGAYGLGMGGAVGLGISRDLLIETWRKVDTRELIVEASHRIAAAVIQANACARITTA